MMWKRWGTKPDLDGPYTSGFEEEFRRSIDRRAKTGVPEISMFFKAIDVEAVRDPGEELKRVLKFRKDLTDSRILLYSEFTNLDEFRSLLRKSISSYIINLKRREDGAALEDTRSVSSIEEVDRGDRASEDENAQMAANSAEFVRNFLARATRSGGLDTLDAADISRFRLIACTFRGSGNDDQVIGTHDANIIYRARPFPEFSKNELWGLLISGIEHYNSENTPIWRWYASVADRIWMPLTLQSLAGSHTARRIGAIQAMIDIGELLPREDPMRREIIEAWLDDEAPSQVKKQALSYLAEFGDISDVRHVENELSKNNVETNSTAAVAAIRIYLRQSRPVAFENIIRLSPERIQRDVVRELFSELSGISNETLILAISCRDPGLRIAAVNALIERDALSSDIARELLDDDSYDIRLAAMKLLVRTGESFSAAERNSLLVQSARQSALGGLAGLAADLGPNREKLEAFNRWELSRLTDQELEAKEGILDRDPHFELLDRRFQQRGDELREAVADRYGAKFNREINALRARHGAEVELVGKIEKLRDRLCKSHTRQGLDIIAKKRQKIDLGLMRQLVREEYILYSSEIVQFLENFGDWSDVPSIIELVERGSSFDRPYLSNSSDQTFSIAASAIRRLSKGKMPDLVNITMPPRLLSHVLAQMTTGEFKQISDDEITSIFRNDNQDVRKAAALRCVVVFSRSKIVKILEQYTDSDKRQYYNIIHWLDLGASIPRDRAIAAAKRILAREWA